MLLAACRRDARPPGDAGVAVVTVAPAPAVVDASAIEAAAPGLRLALPAGESALSAGHACVTDGSLQVVLAAAPGPCDCDPLDWRVVNVQLGVALGPRGRVALGVARPTRVAIRASSEDGRDSVSVPRDRATTAIPSIELEPGGRARGHVSFVHVAESSGARPLRFALDGRFDVAVCEDVPRAIERAHETDPSSAPARATVYEPFVPRSTLAFVRRDEPRLLERIAFYPLAVTCASASKAEASGTFVRLSDLPVSLGAAELLAPHAARVEFWRLPSGFDFGDPQWIGRSAQAEGWVSFEQLDLASGAPIRGTILRARSREEAPRRDRRRVRGHVVSLTRGVGR